MPLLKEEVAAVPAVVGGERGGGREGEKNFKMTLAGAAWTQEPQKYHARSLQEIRRKYAVAKDAPGLGASPGGEWLPALAVGWVRGTAFALRLGFGCPYFRLLTP